MRSFNVTKEVAKKLYQKKLTGVCDICKKPESSKRFLLAIDHNHKTGKVRGLLCNNCNRGLGHFKDNIINLQTAIKYLIRTKQ